MNAEIAEAMYETKKMPISNRGSEQLYEGDNSLKTWLLKKGYEVRKLKAVGNAMDYRECRDREKET